MARVAVVGAGSVGLLFGAALVQAGRHEVVFCARAPFERLRVESATEPLDVPAVVAVDPAALAPADWVLLATKAHQTDGAAAWLAAACGPGTRVVVAQNGLEQQARGEAAVPRGTVVLPAVTYCACERRAPGVVAHSPAQPVRLVVPAGADADALVELFAGAPAAIEPTDAWAAAAWSKLALNVLTAGVCAISGERSEVMARPGVLALVADLYDEYAAVATAAGAPPPAEQRDTMLGMIGALPAGVAPSMLQDRLAGRPTEHDAIYGAVVRAAAAHGVSVPRLQLLHVLLGASSA